MSESESRNLITLFCISQEARAVQEKRGGAKNNVKREKFRLAPEQVDHVCGTHCCEVRDITTGAVKNDLLAPSQVGHMATLLWSKGYN